MVLGFGQEHEPNESGKERFTPKPKFMSGEYLMFGRFWPSVFFLIRNLLFREQDTVQARNPLQ